MRRSLVAGLAMVLAACSTGGGGGSPPPERGRGLVAQVASYEPVVGEDNRLIIGLLTEDNLYVSGGVATFRFSFLGDQGGERQPAGEAEAAFLPILEPGGAPAPPTATFGPASQVGRGVYAAQGVAFDRPGPWEVQVGIVVQGQPRTATAALQVLAEPQVPGVGEKAPLTENLTLESKDAPPTAIDSRAATGEIPDPELHGTTIAEAIGKGRPVLAVFATPVYCVSRFCGPVVDMVSGLVEEWSPRVDFVHVEIWRDYDERVINKAAADWLQAPDGGLTEPWIFLIDGQGTIVQRWDNVATPQEIEPFLEELPPAD